MPISDTDSREVCSRCYTDLFGRSSVVKLYAFIDRAQGRKPETEEDAQRHALLAMIAPMAAKFIPDDPDELDQMLANLSMWALSMRSDSASPLAIALGADDQEDDDDADSPRNDPAPASEAEAPEIPTPPASD